MKNLFKYTVLLIIVSTGISFSQLNPNNITKFTEKDGVPGSLVQEVLIDKFGYVWIGTINGLARYDGYEYTRFYNDPNDSTSIRGLIIWSLFEDSKGRIWVGSSPENLNIYNPITKSFQHYDYKHLIERPAEESGACAESWSVSNASWTTTSASVSNRTTRASSPKASR